MIITPSFLQEVKNQACLPDRQGWQKALYNQLREKGPEEYFRVGDERRADWIFLLPLSKESSVLQLGAEWGHSAIALARRCKTVVVADPISEKRAFLKLRAAQEGISNLTVVESPPHDSFDLIAVTEPPEESKGLFQSIYSRLKKGGTCYVMAKNRGLGRELVRAGFSEPAPYAVLPGHAMPLFFVPLSSPACIRYFLRRVFYLLATAPVEARRRYQVRYGLAKIGVRCLPASLLSLFFQWFSPAFSFIVKK